MNRWIKSALFLTAIAVLLLAAGFIHGKWIFAGRQGGYEATLTAYRSALLPGSTREQVEGFLRTKSVPYERTCCDPGVFSDLAKIDERPPNWFCRNWRVDIEFKFESKELGVQVAAPSDILRGIDIDQNGVCL